MVKLIIDLIDAITELKNRNAKKILLQAPEGLKTKILEIAKEVEEKTGAEVISLVDPVFGACDIPLQEIDFFKADAVLHLGHNEFLKNNKIVYAPLFYEAQENEINKTAETLMQELRHKKIQSIGLFSTIQYLEIMKKFSLILEKNGFKVFSEKGKRTINGQVLGCDVLGVNKIENQVDAVGFLGDGLFHPLAMCFGNSKPVYIISLNNQNIREMINEKEVFIRQRSGIIANAMDSNIFAILVSSKPGQMKLSLAEKLLKEIKNSGKTGFIVAADLLLPENLLGLRADCFVNTACPRIALDDWKRFDKPILTPDELLVVLKKKKFEEVQFFD